VVKYLKEMAVERTIKQKQFDSSDNNVKDRVMITYYTDPLCCWCWAMEKHWNRLLENYRNEIAFKYVLGVMIPDWDTYTDPVNSVSCPMQMGPVWMHAAQLTQTKINYSIWHVDPPSSSYPSCIAVKCASLQSPNAEHIFLQKVRKAVMVDGLNIAKVEVLIPLAQQLEEEMPGRFSSSKFIEDWKSNAVRSLLRKDMEQAAFYAIGRYPTMTLVRKGRGLIMTGYRPYEQLEKTLEKLLVGEPVFSH
jgi:putative protein-disulfide isomerase